MGCGFGFGISTCFGAVLGEPPPAIDGGPMMFRRVMICLLSGMKTCWPDANLITKSRTWRSRGWRSRGAESNRTFLWTLLHSFSAHRLTRISARCKLDVTGIILFQSKILSGPRAQDELLNLAACGQWELVDELNVSGNLKVRNTSLAELLELDRSDLRPRFELHGSGNFLPVLVARDSVHGHVAHRMMRSQVFLDLLRV